MNDWRDMSELPEKRKIVLGVTGSIAAYKSVEMARYFLTRGYHVRVVMTESATRFITPFTFESITGHPVTTEFWNETTPGAIGHIELADWADVVVVAPASADFIAKLAFGFSDSPLLAVALATKAPIVLAPAMNVNMLEHPQTEANMAALSARGVQFVESETGDLACGWTGNGRLAHHREIFWHTRRALTGHDLAGRRILISTGPTREAIDPVRFISNRSSGKMGVALAAEAFRRGADVTMVHGPIATPVKVPRAVSCHPVVSAQEMYDTVVGMAFPQSDGGTPYDVVIMAAAVADYRPEISKSQKVKKSVASASLAICPNPDILLELGNKKGESRFPLLVGFAVETGEVEDLLAEVRRKRSAKNVDLMVGNLADDSFDLDTNRVWLINRTGKEEEILTTYKSRIAVRIFDSIVRLF
jgi:phosphopantothenoylcysteine decarboxylase/phosphopantothenate--cysteine ligase